MKKLTILLVCAVMAFYVLMPTSNIFAQYDNPAKTGFSAKGIKIGVNLANWSGSDAKFAGADKKMRLGLDAGLFGQYLFSDMLGLELDVLYAMKGVKYKTTGGSFAFVGDTAIVTPPSGTTYTAKLDYIDVPLLLTIAPTVGSGFKPILYIGPQVSFLLSGKAKSDLSGGSSADIKDSFKSTDFGLVFGAGAGYKITPTSGLLSLEVRYALGLTKIAKSVAGFTPNVKNGTISILAGLSF